MSAIDTPQTGPGAFVRRSEIAASPPPVKTSGPIAWALNNLFSSVGNAVLTILAILFIAWVLPPILRFVFFDAIFTGADREACLADTVGRPVGACWAFVTTRIGYFLYGQYPLEERWRVNLVWVMGAIGILWLLWPRLGAKGLAGLYFFLAFPLVAVFLLSGGALPFALGGVVVSAVALLFSAVGLVLGLLFSGIGFLIDLPLNLGLRETFALIGWPFAKLAALLGDLRGFYTGSLGVTGFWIDYGVSALVVLGIVAFLSRQSARRGQTLMIAAVAAAAIGLFVWGTALDTGLPEVSTNLWGGLLVTLVIAAIGIVVSLPIGVVLAPGRRSKMPIVSSLSIMFIEFVRGVPLITVLFMANVMLPLFLPPGWRPDSLLRVLIGVAMFASAYMAEVVRGGLQAMPKGQYEGAMALGLSYPLMMIFVILPQALKLVIPGIVNTFIGLFKDTSLVAIVGIFDLMKTIEASNADPKWATPVTSYTGYLFAAIIYFIFCFGMSRYSLAVERRLDTGHKR
ncbi:MAG: amino acid ABC transporter permease [Labrys sp. (in: a-proteobacteria)]|jgi:general L-amino acid transport system permease protein